MSKFQQLLKSAYENEYGEMAKLYSGPSIYDAKGKLYDENGKPIRWYVYYSFRNPITGYLERQDPIYLDVNSFKTVGERTKAIKVLAKAVKGILENGYNPFTDENAFSQEVKELGITDSFKLVLDLKKITMAESSYSDFRSRLRQFESWLIANGYANRYMSTVTKKAVINYLNTVLLKSSPKNRNNTRTAILTLFETLEDNEIVPVNFVGKIKVLESKPTRNKSFTKVQDADIFEELQQHPQLLLFVEFVCLGLLRPIEICRLTIGDVNIRESLIYVKAKNKLVKTKIIPKVLLEKIPDLSKYDRSNYIITPWGFGLPWDAKETNRRNYMSDWFRKIKDKFNLGPEYGIYSFRHTYITIIYRNLRKTLTPFEAKSKLMLITGHTSMAALEKYLRDIDAELPEDFSEHLKSNDDI